MIEGSKFRTVLRYANPEKRKEYAHMHPMVLTMVSLLASQPTHAPQASKGHTVTVRSLVQGSGTVIVYENARDMGKGGTR